MARLTPLARRAKDRRRRAGRHQFDILFARAARQHDATLTAEQYMDAVKVKVRQMGWWAPRPTRGVKPRR